MLRPIVGLLALLVTALVVVSCSRPPSSEIQAARAAIADARAAGAEASAPAQYSAAVKGIQGSEQALARHDYRQALNLAVESLARARDAKRIAEEQTEVARTDAARALGDLESAIQAARARVAAGEVAGATRTRDARLALSETRRAIVVANVAVQKARAALASGDFVAAREATAGVADHLRAVSESKRPASPSPPVRPPR